MKIAMLGRTQSIHFQKWVYCFASNLNFPITVITASKVPIKGIFHVYKLHHAIRPMALRYILLFLLILINRPLKKFEVVHAHYATYYGFIASFFAPNKSLVFGYGSDLRGLKPRKKSEMSLENRLSLFLEMTIYSIKKCRAFCTIGDFYLSKVKQIRKESLSFSILFGANKSIFYPRKKFDEFTIYSNRALLPVYDVSTIVKAFSLLQKYSLRLLISGEGSQMKKLENLVKNYNLESRVLFLGRITSHRELAEILARSHLYISAAKSEGMPVSILESFFSKTAVICANIPELTKFISKELITLTFPLKNHEELARKIEWAILNPPKVNETVERAFKYAIENTTWSLTVEKVIEVSQNILLPISSEISS